MTHHPICHHERSEGSAFVLLRENSRFLAPKIGSLGMTTHIPLCLCVSVSLWWIYYLPSVTLCSGASYSCDRFAASRASTMVASATARAFVDPCSRICLCGGSTTCPR